jgi:hypothetical protein
MAARLTALLVFVIVTVTLIAGLIVGAQRDSLDGPGEAVALRPDDETRDQRNGDDHEDEQRGQASGHEGLPANGPSVAAPVRTGGIVPPTG